MDLWTGYFYGDLALARTSWHREFGAGESIFEEGDDATGVMLVASGKVGIYKSRTGGEEMIRELGVGEVFGEIGALSRPALRTAAARAIEPTILVEVRDNPLQMLKESGEFAAGIVLLKKLICVLGEWLRSRPNTEELAARGGNGAPTADAIESIRKRLPKGFLGFGLKTIQLAKGESLCRQGDAPDGFYFVHSGSLDVWRAEAPGALPLVIGRMDGPTVAGELGFFSGEPRAATLRAAEPCLYTHFTSEAFERLEEKRAEEALEVLSAAAQLVVGLILQRERSV